jgi:Oxygen-sensitive ribonucleoside-triphosphate reductase
MTQTTEMSTTMNVVRETMDLKNMENENANLSEQVFSARNVRVANYVTKNYAMEYLLSGDVREAFQNNWIYIHDFNAYASGNHNCLTLDLSEVLKNGFRTNNADIREPHSISSAMQLTAVIMQCQSNLQFGGIAVGTIDIDLAPYVEKSFQKHYRDGLNYLYGVIDPDEQEHFTDKKAGYPADHPYRKALIYAWDKTVEETHQGAEAMIHNLNSLQSRAADQLPFTSINYGTDTTPCGRLVTKSLLDATIEGVGVHHLTPIFPVQVFQFYKGINDRAGTPNYDLFRLAMKCSALRMFPNYANCTASYFKKPTCKQEIFNTMGCRTQIAEDRFGIKGFQGLACDDQSGENRHREWDLSRQKIGAGYFRILADAGSCTGVDSQGVG